MTKPVQGFFIPYIMVTENKKLITVCDKCLQASCWQGIFMCDDSRTAGTIEKTKYELSKLKLEDPSYWETEEVLTIK